VRSSTETDRGAWTAWRGWLAAGALVVAVVALGRYTPLATLLDRGALAALGSRIASSPWAPGLVVATFVVAGLLLFPVTPLLAATALVFDPPRAIALGLAGALASATLGHAAGGLVARWRPAWLESPRWQPLRERLRRRGVLAMATMRLVPVGNFTLANVLAGAIGIPRGAFLLGNAIGLLGPLLVLTALAHGVRHVGG
jgi:phospholipase D1/2